MQFPPAPLDSLSLGELARGLRFYFVKPSTILDNMRVECPERSRGALAHGLRSSLTLELPTTGQTKSNALSERSESKGIRSWFPLLAIARSSNTSLKKGEANVSSEVRSTESRGTDSWSTDLLLQIFRPLYLIYANRMSRAKPRGNRSWSTFFANAANARTRQSNLTFFY